ncbi:MAG: hypothetical protein Fur0010_25580 [Bdellovibrio sp.]
MLKLIIFISSIVSASENCVYNDQPKIIKSSYSDICYAEIVCSKYEKTLYNTVACKVEKNGKCPSVDACYKDKDVKFLLSKIEVFEKTQSQEGVAK